MFFLYIDESGKTSISDKSLIFTLGGICFHENSWENINQSYINLKKAFFPDLNLYQEVKASNIINPSNSNNQRNIRFVHKVLDIALQRHPSIFVCSVIKHEFYRDYQSRHGRNCSSSDLYSICLKRIASLFNSFLIAENSSRSVKEHGFIITDSRKFYSDDFSLAKKYNRYAFEEKNKNKEFYILESLFFGLSHLYPCLQIADFINYIISARLHLTNFDRKIYPNYSDFSYINQFWSQIHSEIKLEVLPKKR